MAVYLLYDVGGEDDEAERNYEYWWHLNER